MLKWWRLVCLLYCTATEFHQKENQNDQECESPLVTKKSASTQTLRLGGPDSATIQWNLHFVTDLSSQSQAHIISWEPDQWQDINTNNTITYYLAVTTCQDGCGMLNVPCQTMNAGVDNKVYLAHRTNPKKQNKSMPRLLLKTLSHRNWRSQSPKNPGFSFGSHFLALSRFPGGMIRQFRASISKDDYSFVWRAKFGAQIWGLVREKNVGARWDSSEQALQEVKVTIMQRGSGGELIPHILPLLILCGNASLLALERILKASKATNHSLCGDGQSSDALAIQAHVFCIALQK